MAQSSSTGIKDFVKHALASYYKNFQIKLADNAAATDTNPAIKINNGKIFVYNVGGYTGQPGHDINDSSTIQEVINSATNNINDINSEIIDINEKIASIPGTSKMIAGNNDLTIQIGEDGSTYFYVEGYRYNKDTSSFAEGYEENTANGNYSHAEGKHTKAINNAEHAEGQYNQSHIGKTIHSIGIGTSDSIRKNAFEVMQDGSIYVYGLNYDGSTLTNASTLQEVIKNVGCGQTYHAGDNIEITQDNSINALGYTYDSTNKSIIIGYNNGGSMIANSQGAIAGGYVHADAILDVSGRGAYANGYAGDRGQIQTNGRGAYANGYAYNKSIINASGDGACAEGYAENYGYINANGNGAHTNGYSDYEASIDASGKGAHAEGCAKDYGYIYAYGDGAHAEGYAYDDGMLVANGKGAHAEGYNTSAGGDGAHAEGFHTIANNDAEHAEGKYNYSHNGKTIHSVGIGTDDEHRKNAFEVMQDGSIYVYGLGNYEGSALNASTLQEIIKAGSGGQTYHAGNNIEITQDNSINALGYTFDEYSASNKFSISPGSQITTLELSKSNISYRDLGRMSELTINSSNNIKLVSDNKIYLNAETECNNNVTAVAFYQSSDERLKNIKSELNVENCYKLINDCSIIIYSLKTDEKDQNQIGMIAQQVKEIMPEVVQESNGYYSINYSRLSVVTLNLVKDLSERIIELEKDHIKLEELIKRVEKLKK